jgi:hypothetical protein
MGPRTSCLLAAALVAAASCHGPALHVENPDGHTVFLDGVATTAGEKRFRYYGTTRWDALPAEHNHRLDTAHLPTSERVEIPAPASQWLFPFDFPIELVARLFGGRGDQTTVVQVREAPDDPRNESDRVNAELPLLAERGRKARASR